jgi:tetratricopeptide (TPR) repeat protein
MDKAPLTPVEIAYIERIGKLSTNGTAYELLGLDQRGTRDDVERVYRDYVREWHPDRFFSRDAGELMSMVEDNFVYVTRAYKTLRDDAKRKSYDADLIGRGVVVPEVGGASAGAPTGAPSESTSGFEVRIDRAEKGRARITPTDGYRPPSEGAKHRPTEFKVAAPQAVQKVKAQISEQLVRAAGYYETGLEDFRAGRFAKAESALYLATQFDSRNPTYAELFRQAQVKARQARAVAYLNAAQNAEQYQNIRDAISNYRKAIECDPDDGIVYARLARLVREHEEDPREALNLIRRAVAKEPRRIEFRVQLAEMYHILKMDANAIRELQSALDMDPKHEGARMMQKRLREAGVR